MSEYPFNLRGQQKSFSGRGNKDGETWKSVEFQLRQGIVVAEISHHGQGDFKLRFTQTESYGGDEKVGSIIEVGYIAAGFAMGLLEGLLGEEERINSIMWKPVETTGRFSTFDIARVSRDGEGALSPGKYRIEVESKAAWECRFIQPDLGQPQIPLTDEDDEVEEIEPGLYVIGPCDPTRRPILAEILHKGPGELYAFAYSVDGTHSCTIHAEEGQFYVEQVQTEIRTGKEYMFLIGADSEWNITFTEGY